MNRKQLEERLQLLGGAVACGVGGSDAFAGAKLWQGLMEGGGGGSGGQGWTWLYTSPRHAPAIAEIARAVVERLDPKEQATVWAMYCAGLHTRQQQAASLSIKVPALKARRRKIFVKLLDWFSPGARALRAEADAGAEEAARIAGRVASLESASRLVKAREAALKRANDTGRPAFGPRVGRWRPAPA